MIDKDQWIELEKTFERVIRQTIVNEVAVSTVLLPYPPGYETTYETMIFPRNGDNSFSTGTEIGCRQYHSLEKAIEGHEKICNYWADRDGIQPEKYCDMLDLDI